MRASETSSCLLMSKITKMIIAPVLLRIQWSVVVVETVVYSPGQLCLVVSRIIPGSAASNLLLQHSPKFCGLPTVL